MIKSNWELFSNLHQILSIYILNDSLIARLAKILITMIGFITIKHNLEHVEVSLLDGINGPKYIPLYFCCTWRGSYRTSLDPSALGVQWLKQVTIPNVRWTKFQRWYIHIFENTVKKCVNFSNLEGCNCLPVPILAVEDNPECCSYLAVRGCVREVHSMHLKVHAHVIDRMFTPRVPVELISFEFTRSIEWGSVSRMESLDQTIDLNLVGRVVVWWFYLWISNVLLVFSECLNGIIMWCIGVEIDRRLPTITALVSIISRKWRPVSSIVFLIECFFWLDLS